MARNIEITIDVYLLNSKVDKVSIFRRMVGVLFLKVARWLLKSELRIESVDDRLQTPPLHYWQHDETGRVCATVLQPSERWHEINKGQYEMISGAMVNNEP